MRKDRLMREMEDRYRLVVADPVEHALEHCLLPRLLTGPEVRCLTTARYMDSQSIDSTNPNSGQVTAENLPWFCHASNFEEFMNLLGRY
jgi:hypothetical protein